MLYFRQESGWQRMIHDFKYRSAWRVARELGRWYGRRLAESGWYGDVDLIIPMPLHPLKQLQRGYNQASYLAEGMGLSMGVKVERRAVRRARYTSSQAQTPMRQRASNVEDAFAVRRAELLRGKHLLIVDDVLTTGSTVAALCSAILRAVPDCRISVAVLAASRASLGVE
jgi:ComF family protein